MAAPADPQAFGRALRGDFVVLIAGRNETKLTVHKELICSQSSYFKMLFKGAFREAKEGVAKLPDVEPEDLQKALYCLYYATIPGEQNEFEDIPDPVSYLVDLWIVADRLLLGPVQNRTMRALCDILADHRQILNCETIIKIHNKTSQNSMLRKLATHAVAANVVDSTAAFPGQYEECFDQLEGFGVQVCTAIRLILNDIWGKKTSWEKAFNADHFWVFEV